MRKAKQAVITAEALAKLFHETYVRLAPTYGFPTTKYVASWDDVTPEQKRLMVATCRDVLRQCLN